MGKCLKISQKLHRGDRKQIVVCKKQKTKQKSQNRRMSYFSSLCQPTSLISHNWSVTYSLVCWSASHMCCCRQKMQGEKKNTQSFTCLVIGGRDHHSLTLKSPPLNNNLGLGAQHSMENVCFYKIPPTTG